MMCYQDKTFCSKTECKNTKCDRHFDKAKEGAERLGLPISITDYSEKCKEYKEN